MDYEYAYEYGELDRDSRLWGMLAHLSGLLGFTGFPFIGIIAPAVIMFTKGDRDSYVRVNAREALNFQITLFIYIIAAALLCVILIGIPLLLALIVAAIILPIKAGVRANDGELYRYPFTIRLLD